MKCDRVAVCSRSFSNNEQLRGKLLESYPNTRFNDSGATLVGGDLVSFIGHAEKVIVGIEEMSASEFRALSSLKVIAKYGVGLDKIDLAAAKRFGIKVGWRPGVNALSVAELILSHILMAVRKSRKSFINACNGDWDQVQGNLLTGKSVGILGCGHVGKQLVRLLKPFIVEIHGYDIANLEEYYSDNCIVPHYTIESLLQSVDVLVLAVPLSEATLMLIDHERLGLLRDGSVLINCARGGLIDENSLDREITSGRLTVGLDVFEQEPSMRLNKWKDYSNFFMTGHIGGSSVEAVEAMGLAAIENLDSNFIT